MNDKDRSVIPAGEFCYRVVPLGDGEVLSNDADRYGKDLREFRYHHDLKQVACPYFRRSNYGTVRCNYLDVEVRDDRDLINAHFNDEDAADRYPMSHFLVDEIKECNVNMDGDDGDLIAVVVVVNPLEDQP